MPIKAEQKAESVQLLKDVDEDRKYMIQATIVRVMKSRKSAFPPLPLAILSFSVQLLIPLCPTPYFFLSLCCGPEQP